MNYRLAGIGAAIGAFFVAGIFTDQLIFHGPGTALVGGVAAWFTWKYFIKKEQEDLTKLLNPPAETWAMPLPVAWGTIRDVLDGAKVSTGVSGTSGWRIDKEDDSRGIISAQLNFSEHVGGPTTGQVLPRTVSVSAQLTPEGSSTKIQFTYNVFSPMNYETVKKIVSDTHSAFGNTAQINKGSV